MNNKIIKISYIVPSISISGGIAVILQHANRLSDRGYDVNIINLDQNSKDEIDWFDCNIPIIKWKFNKNEFPLKNTDIAIATYFTTVRVVDKYVNARRKLYFVQSDERRFDLDADLFLECQSSYAKKSFEFFTMARWAQRWLKEEFGNEAYYVPNGLDEKLFFKTEPLKNRGTKKRVLIEGPISVPFKGVEDAYRAVKDLDCELWIISSSGKPRKNWKYDRFFESVPINEMNKIYSSCDILLKMSKVESFAYPPLEAMACGCSAVILKVTGIEEYAISENNCIVVGNVNQARKAVRKLIENDDLREKIIKNGFETAKNWSWNKSIDYLEKVIKKDKVEIFYSDHFPEKYDYNKIIGNIKEKIIFNTARELRKLRKELLKTKKENEFIKSSHFWKLRNNYIYIKESIKFLFLHPEKFIKKRFNKLAKMFRNGK